MNENSFEIGRVKYKAVPQEANCFGCAFEDDKCACNMAPPCWTDYREDGRSVIFVEAIQTNGDRLRAMSNEELAEYQIHRVDDCPDLIKDDAPCRIKKNYETQTDCKKCWLDWLNSPAESEVNHELR